MEQARSEQSRLAARLRTLYARQSSLETTCRRAQAYYQQTGDRSLMSQAEQELSNVAREIREAEMAYQRLENSLQQMAKSWKDKDYRNNSKLWKQGQELDADTRGLRYSAAAGYNPEGLLRALVKLRKANIEQFGNWALGADGQGTHPPLSTRIQIAEKVLADWRRSGR